VIDLNGQTAVITGGGRGLGRVFAQTLAGAGASVAVIARNAEELNETVASIGGHARAFPVDVTDARKLNAIFAEVGRVDILINNAGVIGPIGPFWEVDFDEWWRTMDINIRGALLCTRSVLPGMIERRSGRIVNLVTGAVPSAYLSPYMTSKTALVRATECIAAEAKPHGVALFSVAPGTVKTDMSMHSVNSPEALKWIPWFRRIFDEHLDLPPERPAQLILELASGKADALSGLYLTPFDDLDAILQNLAEVETQKLHSLRVRPLASSAATAAIAAIRDAGQQAKPQK
jgi:NAD(P)-dependent dehydrogenase (short-subunit alcohol dehydrogenase family)